MVQTVTVKDSPPGGNLPAGGQDSLPSPGRESLYPVLALLAFLVLFRLLAAALLPVTQDEAYYSLWAKHLDLGYSDHPPLIAWLASTANLLAGSALAVRLGTLLITTLTLFATIQLLRSAGLGKPQQIFAGLVLFSFNLAGILLGFLTTPDVILVLAWTLALNEASVALTSDPRRWVTAGLACGLGLLAKYIVVVIGLVFLWAVLRDPSRQIRTRWPWLGVVAALLVFLPHLAWNAGNEWITLRFQLIHRLPFSQSDSAEIGSHLPAPLPGNPESPVWQLSSYYHYVDPDVVPSTEPPPSPPEPKSRLSLAVHRVGELFWSQIFLWGAFVVPLVVLLLRDVVRRALRQDYRLESGQVHSRLGPLLWGAVWIPIVFFSFISIFTRVEANWPAIYLVGASVLLTPLFTLRKRTLLICAAVNLLLVATLIAHSRNPFLPTTPMNDRILRETHGYRALAEYTGSLDDPLFAESYQIASMITFYRPHAEVTQWPDITTRRSELTRRAEFIHQDWSDVLEQGGFWLITTLWPAPQLPEFSADQMIQLEDCLDAGFQETRAFERPSYTPKCQDRAVHTWFAVHYVKR